MGKRAFLDEFLSKVRLSEEIIKAGITQFKPTLLTEVKDWGKVDWNQLFDDVRELDICFIHGTTWYHNNDSNIRDAIKRNATIRVIIADPQDAYTLTKLALLLNITEARVIDNINRTVDFFKSLSGSGSNIQIWYLSTIPLFNFYRFDNTIVFSLYSHRSDGQQKNGPTFLLRRGGILYDFVQKDFDAMINTMNNLVRYDSIGVNNRLDGVPIRK